MSFFMMAKRKLEFYSHLSNEKLYKKQSVEELVSSCYVREIVEQVEAKAAEKCNLCHCTFQNLMECYFTGVLIGLEKDASGVLERFEGIVKDSSEGYYKHEDVLNAKKMLECEVHRRFMAQKNYKYFYETVLTYKD